MLDDPHLAALARVVAAARRREKGYFEYLWELRLARERYGPMAGDFELALELAFAREIAEKAKKK